MTHKWLHSIYALNIVFVNYFVRIPFCGPILNGPKLFPVVGAVGFCTLGSVFASSGGDGCDGVFALNVDCDSGSNGWFSGLFDGILWFEPELGILNGGMAINGLNGMFGPKNGRLNGIIFGKPLPLPLLLFGLYWNCGRCCGNSGPNGCGYCCCCCCCGWWWCWW